MVALIVFSSWSIARCLRTRQEAKQSALTAPSRTAQGQPAPALRLGDPRVTALLGALCLFVLTPEGITNRRLVARLPQVPLPPAARQADFDFVPVAVDRRAVELPIAIAHHYPVGFNH